MSSKPLPSFANPPVAEAVLSVEFAPLAKWGIPHLGLFWQRIRDDFPTFQTKPTLASEIETFNSNLGSVERSIQIFPSDPDVRCWYVSEDGSQIIQVQKDRFIYNWRKQGSGDYPRYNEFMRPKFQKHWKNFLAFLSEESIENPSVVQCEVTYVNHIIKGEGWNVSGDIAKIFTFFNRENKADFLPEVESAKVVLNYVLPEQKGRLRISAHHAIRQHDGVELVGLNVMARGKPSSSKTEDIIDWMNFGREWAVNGFADITTTDIQKFWGRES